MPPGNVAANTCNIAYVVGEKSADNFIRELGLRDLGWGCRGHRL